MARFPIIVNYASTINLFTFEKCANRSVTVAKLVTILRVNSKEFLYLIQVYLQPKKKH